LLPQHNEISPDAEPIEPEILHNATSSEQYCQSFNNGFRAAALEAKATHFSFPKRKTTQHRRPQRIENPAGVEDLFFCPYEQNPSNWLRPSLWDGEGRLTRHHEYFYS
jgi:hypothetical protein